MVPLPEHGPQNLSLGPLETEILDIIYDLEEVTVKDVHDRILADPDRELAYASVTTVMRRLTKKGWLDCDKGDRAFRWRPRVSREQAQMLKSHDRLKHFLAVSSPELVAAFADSLDVDSLDRLDAIAQRIQAVRRQREEQS